MAEIYNDIIVSLPYAVEELIAKICIEQNQRPLETNTRLTLASLGEQVAFDILWRISGQEIRKSFDESEPHYTHPFIDEFSKRDYIKEEDRVKDLNWDSGKEHIHHCHVYPDGSYRFKGPYLSKQRNVLQRTLGEDNILMVNFEEVKNERDSVSSSLDDYFAKYNKVLREGIHVVFKDGSKKKDPTTSPVKYCFIRMDSVALIDNQDNISCGKTIRQARSLFMHVDNLSSLSNYMARFSLILSKTMNLEVDLSDVDIKTISDVPCHDKDGNVVYGIDGKPLIHTDGTRFISHDLALKCPKNLFKELASELPILRFVAMSLISL
ncbi:RNA-DEPENDENT RNA polymerase 3-RELATED [Salix koriyanagi]|uniref:RNA-dependent RNA polymerase n=1 Tax=Salix koriyanagi TaxID=2511006 RepID=A0A9Q0VDF4_9ROSI|nr:RNA-DEPENDENT RNA polymerase 3-RELATED [Salix koriyanagi]